MTSTFEQVAAASLRIHDGLILWARSLLREAGLEAIEVYGQFPPEGSVAHHVVLFPYALGPDPKLQHNAASVPVVELAKPGRDGADRVSAPMLALAQALNDVRDRLLGQQPSSERHKLSNQELPALDALPASLRDWYLRAPTVPDPWCVGKPESRRARLPALSWRPGFVLSVRYVAVAADVGRGSYDRTSVGAPMSLPALSVLAAGLHIRRTILTPCPPTPVPELLESWVAALEPELRDALTPLLAACRAEQMVEVSLNPAQDLTTQEFALLMQALQRPLQAALNLQMRFRLADCIELLPSTLPMHRLDRLGAPK